MSPELLDTALGALRLSMLFSVALFLPLVLQLLLLFFFGWAFGWLAYRISPTIGSLLELIGTPLHEFSHAVVDLITFCGVKAIKLLSDDAGVAFVQASRSHFLRSILAGLAPLFSGTTILWLSAVYVIPGFEVSAATLPHLDLESAGSFGVVLTESVDYLGRFLETAYQGLFDLQWDNWRTYVGLYVALSVGIGIAPSGTDLKSFLRGLPLAVILILGLFARLYVSGDAESQFLALQERLVPHLLSFSTVVTYAFMLTMLGVLAFLPLRLWRKLRGK
jgi:hypothetical protein